MQKDKEGAAEVRQNSTAPVENPPPPKIAESEAKAEKQGVVSRLQEGHFQGVADLRLRINFHQELTALSYANAQHTVEVESRELMAQLDVRLQSIGDMHGFVEEIDTLFGTFSETVDSLLANSQPEGVEANSFFTSMREGLGQLVDGLIGLEQVEPIASEMKVVEEDDKAANIAPGELVDTVDAAGPVQPVTHSPFFLAVQEVQEWFWAEFDQLEQRVDQLTSLSPVGELRGKGAAYSKFLEIYNSLNTIAEKSGDSGPATESSSGVEVDA